MYKYLNLIKNIIIEKRWKIGLVFIGMFAAPIIIENFIGHIDERADFIFMLVILIIFLNKEKPSNKTFLSHIYSTKFIDIFLYHYIYRNIVPMTASVALALSVLILDINPFWNLLKILMGLLVGANFASFDDIKYYELHQKEMNNEKISLRDLVFGGVSSVWYVFVILMFVFVISFIPIDWYFASDHIIIRIVSIIAGIAITYFMHRKAYIAFIHRKSYDYEEISNSIKF